jgi:hypothetical protein
MCFEINSSARAVPLGAICKYSELVVGNDAPIHPPDGIIAHDDLRCWNDKGNHQHRSNNNPFAYGLTQGRYDANRVWVNETYTVINDGKNSHGYIDETPWTAPDYFFSNRWSAWTDDTKSLVNNAFNAWSGITSDVKYLKTGILFNSFDVLESVDVPDRGTDKFEIRISRGSPNDYYPLRKNVAETFQIAQDVIELVFRDDSKGKGTDPITGLPFDWDFTNDWYYDGKGDRQAFIDSGKKNDFLTVALHEAGHIIGLSHQSDEDDIMFEYAGDLSYIKEFPDASYRKFSTDDTNGARDLYSVPICVVKTEKSSSLTLQNTSGQSSCIDFGDAPDSYKTLLGSDGPRYNEGLFQKLGRLWDGEPDGQPTPYADGDDIGFGCGLYSCNLSPDDEDGVDFGDNWVDVTFNITRPDPYPYQLRAWWDTNYNGSFDHATELYINDILTLSPGSFTNPKRYNLGFNPKAYGLYSRFRLTWDPLDLDVKPYGEYYSKADCTIDDAAAENCTSHGEVEDYVHVPAPLPLLGVGAAFGYSRKLRKRIKISKSPDLISAID